MVLDDDERGHNAAAALGIGCGARGGRRARRCSSPATARCSTRPSSTSCSRGPSTSRSALIVPDRHGTGTNALLLTPPDALDAVVRPGQLPAPRRERPGRAGPPHEVVEVPSLALDIDTPEDLDALRAALEATHGGAAHTRGMLSS